MENTKILVMSTSKFFRTIIIDALSKTPNLEVINVACNPFEMEYKILESNPNIIIIDMDIPKIDSLSFLREIKSKYDIPIIVISECKECIKETMNMGIDFILKSTVCLPNGINYLLNKLISKIEAIPNFTIDKKANIHYFHTAKNILSKYDNDNYNKKYFINV